MVVHPYVLNWSTVHHQGDKHTKQDAEGKMVTSNRRVRNLARTYQTIDEILIITKRVTTYTMRVIRAWDQRKMTQPNNKEGDLE